MPRIEPASSPSPPLGPPRSLDDSLLRALDRYAREITPRGVRRVLERAFEALAPRDAVLSSGLGMEGCALIDLAAPLGLPLRVVFLDTGFHFGETLALLDRLTARHPSLTFEVVEPAQTPAEQAAAEGPRLWLEAPDRCCALRKVEPLAGRLEGADLWISAVGRTQSAQRAAQPVLSATSRFGPPKLAPLVHWSRREVWRHVRAHDVPFNPLHLRSYPSIGCRHCTLPVPGLEPGEYSRDGRWSAHQKTECGLHVAHPANTVTVTVTDTDTDTDADTDADAVPTLPTSTRIIEPSAS